jgi:hypothetical protein
MSVIFEYLLQICQRGVMFAIVVKEANRIDPPLALDVSLTLL